MESAETSPKVQGRSSSEPHNSPREQSPELVVTPSDKHNDPLLVRTKSERSPPVSSISHGSSECEPHHRHRIGSRDLVDESDEGGHTYTSDEGDWMDADMPAWEEGISDAENMGKKGKGGVEDNGKNTLQAGKCLFVCCDGTWNNAVGTQLPVTNVGRLARCLRRHAKNKEPHMVYYSSGVGTTAGRFGNWYQGAIGEGLDENILNAYYFLCQNYSFELLFSCRNKHGDTNEPFSHSCTVCPTDEIVLVGFSRGGFTVRCLAAFVDRVGLLRRRGLPFLNALFRLWRLQRSEADGKKLDRFIAKLESNKFLIKPRINVLAEWDTVSAMGRMRFRPPEFSFVTDTVPGCVDSAFHAISIHESRYRFAPMPYHTASSRTKTVRQCLFVGCHSDIGGGSYDAGLSMLSFLWMVASISNVSSAQFDNAVIFGYHVPLAVESRLPSHRNLWRREKSTFISCSHSKGYLQHSHRNWWKLVKWISLGLTVRPRDKYWRAFNRDPLLNDQSANQEQPPEQQPPEQQPPEQQPQKQQPQEQQPQEQQPQEEAGRNLFPSEIHDVSLEVHWTVRMLRTRYNTSPGCLPGYQSQKRDRPNEPANGLPADSRQPSRYYWSERTESKISSESAQQKGFQLQECEPDAEERGLYEAWFKYDGQLYDGKKHKTQKRDHEWLNVLSGFTEKEDVKVPKRDVRDETMREWFLDLRKDISSFGEDD